MSKEHRSLNRPKDKTHSHTPCPSVSRWWWGRRRGNSRKAKLARVVSRQPIPCLLLFDERPQRTDTWKPLSDLIPTLKYISKKTGPAPLSQGHPHLCVFSKRCSAKILDRAGTQIRVDGTLMARVQKMFFGDCFP